MKEEGRVGQRERKEKERRDSVPVEMPFDILGS